MRELKILNEFLMIVYQHKFLLEILQKLLGDALQSLLGPLEKPINGRAVD